MDATLSSDEKLQIMRFICAFAWADLKVVNAEKKLIARFSDILDLSPKEREAVNGWIAHPPRPEEIDPYEISPHLKETILSAAQAVSMIDGHFDAKEADLIDILQNLFDEDGLSPEGDDESED